MKPVPSLHGLTWPLMLTAVVGSTIAGTLLIRTAPRAWAVPAVVEPATGEGVVCFGTVDLEQGVSSLAPLQPGRVVEVLVRENERVEKGTELVRLEDGPSRSRLEEAEASLRSNREQLEQARKLPGKQRDQVARQEKVVEAAAARVTLARQVLAQRQKIAQPAAIASVDLAATELQVREAEALERAETLRLAELKAQDFEADIRRADYERAAAEARRDQARLALDECRVKAPRAGTLLRCNVGPGDLLAPERAVPALLFAAEGPQVVRATVEQEFAPRVKEGLPALVQDETNDSLTWRGKVERVAAWYSQRRTVLHDPAQMTDVRTLECVIVLDGDQPPLRLGQSVRVLIGSVPR